MFINVIEYLHWCIWIYVYLRAYVYIHTHPHIYIYMWLCIDMHAHTHTYIYMEHLLAKQVFVNTCAQFLGYDDNALFDGNIDYYHVEIYIYIYIYI